MPPTSWSAYYSARLFSAGAGLLGKHDLDVIDDEFHARMQLVIAFRLAVWAYPRGCIVNVDVEDATALIALHGVGRAAYDEVSVGCDSVCLLYTSDAADEL